MLTGQSRDGATCSVEAGEVDGDERRRGAVRWGRGSRPARELRSPARLGGNGRAREKGEVVAATGDGVGGFAPVQIQPREGGGGREVLGRRGGVAEEDGGAVGVAMGGVGSAGSIPIQIGSGGGEWRRGEGG